MKEEYKAREILDYVLTSLGVNLDKKSKEYKEKVNEIVFMIDTD